MYFVGNTDPEKAQIELIKRYQSKEKLEEHEDCQFFWYDEDMKRQVLTALPFTLYIVCQQLSSIMNTTTINLANQKAEIVNTSLWS